ERVLNTPRSGFAASSRGWTRRTSRRARSSQVRTMSRSPGATSVSASATDSSNASHASGAPSSPCFGAEAGSVSDDSTLPIGVSSPGSGTTSLALGRLVDEDRNAVADYLRVGQLERLLVARGPEQALALAEDDGEHHQSQ